MSIKGVAVVDEAAVESLEAQKSRVALETQKAVSGHSVARRFRFAYSLVGPYVATSTISFGKDLYLLEFGASAQAIGAILVACSFVSPVMDSAVGSLQDRGRLCSRFFPSETWGRRAPWYLTHNAALAPLLFAFFLPPSYGDEVLHIWFTIVWLLVYWCTAACVNAFEATRVEIYPFKEERVALEQYCKLTVGVGGGIGTAAAFLCLTFPKKSVFVLASLVCFLSVLTGGLSVQVLREARSREAAQTQAPGEQATSFKLGAMLRSPLVLRMLVLRMLQGTYETVMPTLQLYYFTFVFKMFGGERLFWFSVGGFLMAVSELGLAPVWSHLFAKSTTLMLYLPLGLRVVDAILAPIMLFIVKDVRVFVAYLCVWRVCNSSYSYWRIAACGWICDVEGGEREGLLLGLFTMVQNVGRALTSAVGVLGLGWAGLITLNCLQLSGDDSAQCERQKMDVQPESLRVYLEVMVAWVAPLVELIIVVLTWEFPIRPGSQMLADLCKRQADAVLAKSPSLRSMPSASLSCAPLPNIAEQRKPSDPAIVGRAAWADDSGAVSEAAPRSTTPPPCPTTAKTPPN